MMNASSSCYRKPSESEGGSETLRIKQPGSVLSLGMPGMAVEWASDILEVKASPGGRVEFTPNGLSFYNSIAVVEKSPLGVRVAVDSSGSILAASWKIAVVSAACSDCLGGTFSPSVGVDAGTECAPGCMSYDGATSCAAPTAPPLRPLPWPPQRHIPLMHRLQHRLWPHASRAANMCTVAATTQVVCARCVQRGRSTLSVAK